MSFLITIFILLSSNIEKIYSKPLNEDNSNINKTKENEGNTTLKIFLIVVALFIISSVLYYTKSLWGDWIKRLFTIRRSNASKSSDPDMDISEQNFENIQFDSINFSEVHGNSILSIDITNLFERYLDTSKDSTSSSSIIELGSISQNSTPKPNSKTFININNTKFSPNLVNYNAFEDELNNLKSQEITDSKIPNETSFIENSSFINAESIDISKKILVGINNIEINPNINIKSLENKNTIEKEKCESIKSKKSVLSKKSHKSENDQINLEEDDIDNENESLNNSYVNVNDEKTLINKSLKPTSLNGYSSVQEIDSENNQEFYSIPTSSNEIEEADKIRIATHTKDEKLVSSVTKDKFATSTINQDTPASIISSLKENQQNKSDEELSISSYEESISNVGAKIDPIDINDDSMSSLDIGEVNSTQDEEDSIDDVSEDHYESNPQSQTFIILKDNKPIGDIELIITPSPDETKKSSKKIDEQVDKVEIVENKTDINVENKIPSTENIEPISKVENIENIGNKTDVKVEETEKPSSEIIEPITNVENIENNVKVEETEKPTTEIIEPITNVENIENNVKVEETEKPTTEIIEPITNVENIENNVKVEETEKPTTEIIEQVAEAENVENKTDLKVEEIEKPTTEIIEQVAEIEKVENKTDVKVEEIKKPSSEIIEPVTEVENIENKIDVKVEETKKPSSEIIEPVTEVENVENITDIKVEESEKPSTEILEQIAEVENIENKIDVKVEENKKPSSEIIEPVTEVENVESITDVKVEESEKPYTEIKEPVIEVQNIENKIDVKVEEAGKPFENLQLNEPNIERMELQTESNIVSDNKKSEIDNKKFQMEMIEEKIQAIQTSIENDFTNVKPPLNEIVETPSESSKNSFKDEVNDVKDENKPKLKLNKRTSSLNLHIKKRKESISSKANYNSSKASKHNKKKKIKQSINEEIESIANEIDNDTIKEKFNNYIEKRNSLQSIASSNSSNSKRSSALSTYILNNENSELPDDKFENDAEKYKSNTHSSKLTLNIDTSINKIHSYKEDNTPDKESPSVTPSSLTASQLHNQLKSPTPTGLSNSYNHNISPSPSGTSSSDSLHELCISPTPSEESTISNGSHSYSIGKISRHKQFEVVYDHKPQLPDEIPLRKGDIVQVKQVFEDGWAYGIVKKKHLDGIFPIQCLGEEIEPSRNGRMVPRLVRVYQARLEDEEQERQEEEEFKKKVNDQARKNVLLKLALSHPK